jgi:polyribonucleotide nucleotidyltransferase
MNRIDIPAEIKVGLVIGKNGAVCKSIRDQFNVKMFVDIPNHCVKLNGSPQNVAQAQRELLKMFENFSLKGSSTYSHAKFFATALKDAQGSCWKFIRQKVTDDELEINHGIQGMEYVLVAAPLDNADQSLNDVAISPR